MNYNENLNNGFLNDLSSITTNYGMDGCLEDASIFFKDNTGSIEDIVSYYNTRDINNIVNMIPNDNSDIKNQVLELYNNVKNLIENRDVNLIRNSIESIQSGMDNALRFMNEQGDMMDENTHSIMNLIIREYSNHLNYLNQAINILE